MMRGKTLLWKCLNYLIYEYQTHFLITDLLVCPKVKVYINFTCMSADTID